MPSGNGAADRDARVVARERGELVGVRAANHDVAHIAALEAVEKVIGGEQRGRRNDDRAELDGRQHGFPERNLVAQHHQDPVTAGDAQ